MATTRINFHPAYLANRDAYQRHRDWLEGTPDALANDRYVERTYLETVDKGGAQKYAERLALLDTDNSIHALLSIHHSELCKDAPSWNGMESDDARLILDDITGSRKSAWGFAKDIGWQLLWAGFAAVETFAPPRSGDRLVDARQAGHRSYSRLYEPDDVVDWEYFDDDGAHRGELRRVVFRNRVQRVEERIKGKLETNYYQTYKVLWIDSPGERFKMQILRASTTIIASSGKAYVDAVPDEERGEEKTGDLNFIPVTFFGDPVDGVRHTVLYRACFDARIKLNKQSHYDTTTRYNHYPRHIISGSDDPEQDEVNTSNTSLGVISGRDVEVHTLQAADPVALWRDIQRLDQAIRNKILLQSNQAVNPESKEQPSVDSKRADHEARKKFYEDVTDELEYGLEYLLGWVHAAFEGDTIKADEVDVVFPRDFALKDHETELQEQAVLWARSGSMGEAGAEFRKRLFVNDVLRTPIETVGDETEEEVRQAIVDKILSQPVGGLESDLAAALLRRRLDSQARDDDDLDDDEDGEQERREAA